MAAATVSAAEDDSPAPMGSVVATGTAGPLRTGFGALREHVLGATLATGAGRIVRAGGRVVKNVAGYDLAKLATGSFGSFGVVTSVNRATFASVSASMSCCST